MIFLKDLCEILSQLTGIFFLGIFVLNLIANLSIYTHLPSNLKKNNLSFGEDLKQFLNLASELYNIRFGSLETLLLRPFSH